MADFFKWFLNADNKDQKALLGSAADQRSKRLDAKRYPVGNSFYTEENRAKILAASTPGAKIDMHQFQVIMERAYYQHINEEKYVVDTPTELGTLIDTLNATCVSEINELIARNKRSKARSDDILRHPKSAIIPRMSVATFDSAKNSEFVNKYSN
jgi:hypothetical protein